MKKVLVCSHCGHKWKPLDPGGVKKSLEAAKVNKDGPFCGLCRCLFDSKAHAEVRGLMLTVRSLEIMLENMALLKSKKK